MKLKAQMLAALKTFEAAGRLGSFSEAACELCVTTGAVSQQIRKLEAQLGVTLFVRLPRGIALTGDGQELLGVTQRSLAAIEQAIERIRRHQVSDEVRLKSTPSFVFKWLIPRLQEFSRAYPDIRVETFADAALLELEAGDFDLAINYGFGEYPGFLCDKLMDEQLLPVMSPDYMPGADWSSAGVWQQASLLHDAMPWPEAQRDAEWRYWLDASALQAVDSSRGHYFNRVDMAIAAASAGLGVALARRSLVTEELSGGRLLAPLPAVGSHCSYYLLRPENAAHPPAVEILRTWLLERAAGEVPTAAA